MYCEARQLYPEFSTSSCTQETPEKEQLNTAQSHQQASEQLYPDEVSAVRSSSPEDSTCNGWTNEVGNAGDLILSVELSSLGGSAVNIQIAPCLIVYQEVWGLDKPQEICLAVVVPEAQKMLLSPH